MPRHHTLDFNGAGMAVLSLNEEGRSVNVLGTEFLTELTQTLTRLHSMKETKGLLIRSLKPKQFIAGANIEEIAAVTNSEEAAAKAKFGQDLMTAIETLPFPSAAAIDGTCVGGGLELALACTYRIVGDGPHVKLGLPETKLGIIPGFGGSNRLPQIVGLEEGLKMILRGSMLDGKRAFRIGLADDVAASEILESVAMEWLKNPKKLSRPTKLSFQSKMIQKLPPLRSAAFSKARKATLKETKGAYPALPAAIDVIEATFGKWGPEGFELEAKRVGDLATSPVSKALIGIFEATESIRREKLAAEPKPVRKVGLIGAGVMGGGIAQLISARGKPVRMRDISMDALGKAMQVAYDLNKKELKKKRIDAREMYFRTSRISPTLTLSGFGRTDLVIEAVVEKMEIKKKVFEEVSKRTPKETVLATNTSALSVTQISTAAEYPERVIGLHFFNPVHRMPLVEVIRGEHTSDETTATTVAFALSIGKTPIIVKDSPGFLVNRILGLYLNEAALAAEEGTPISVIETEMKDFGMPMGPFELIDEIGLDIAEEVGKFLQRSFPHFPKAAELISKVKESGRLGKKNGKGFYNHADGGKTLDTSVAPKAVSSAPAPPDIYGKFADRFILLMVNEAARCLQEQVVRTARDVDIGMVFGTGFPPFRGGLLKYANHRSLSDVELTLQELAQRHGERFKPVPLIRELAAKGATF